MALADSLGIKKVLVRTGLGESSLAEFRNTWADVSPDYVAVDVLDAANWILAEVTAANARRKRPA